MRLEHLLFGKVAAGDSRLLSPSPEIYGRPVPRTGSSLTRRERTEKQRDIAPAHQRRGVEVHETERAGWGDPSGARQETNERRAHGGCLGFRRRRRTRRAAKLPGDRQERLDPGVSEWGNPRAWMARTPRGGPTRGTETSQYPQEKKETSIPRVAASERGLAQTGAVPAAPG